MAEPAKAAKPPKERTAKEDEIRGKREQLAADAAPTFDKLRKAMKQIQLYRHNTDRYGEYIDPVYQSMNAFLEAHGAMQLRVEALSYKIYTHTVFEDDSRDANLIYPLWQAGIRLLIFKPGLSQDELLRFLLVCMAQNEEGRRRGGEDIITQLWKAEFDCIEYIVVEGFKALPDEDIEEVEVEVEKVVAYLYKQLSSNSDDYLRFARLTSADLDLELNDVDQMRGVVIAGTSCTAADRARLQQSIEKEEKLHLNKMVTVLFQLLELDTSEDNFEDVAEAFVQLLDAQLLQEQFSAIHQIRERFVMSAQKQKLKPGTRDLIQRCADRFVGRMAETQRLQAIGNILNSGLAKDPEGIMKYLDSLGVEAIVPLLDMLEGLQLLPNRRVVIEVLARLGKNHVATFMNRLQHPSSNMVKDMLYVIDKIDPPNKFAVFGAVLEHPNAILRLETLAMIGRNPSDDCFDMVVKILRTNQDAQMRAQAIRMLPNYEPEQAAPILLEFVASENFDKANDFEKKATFMAIVQMQAPQTNQFIAAILNQKSGMFAKKKVDDLKMLAIGGLESTPSVQGIQLLAEVAKDASKHSKDVCEIARAAVINMRAKLMGA